MGTAMEGTHSGHLWECCSCNRVITISNYNVTSLAFGNNHCLFLTSDNAVFGFGSNEWGQLATGDKTDHLKEPYKITTLPNNISAIACGAYTSAALTSDGVLLMWGKNQDMQCSIENCEAILSPVRVELLPAIATCKHIKPQTNIFAQRITKVSCGYTHTMAITTSNELWIWGSGLQLGIPGVTRTGPVALSALRNRKIISVSCGFDYSLAVCSTETVFDIDHQDYSNSSNTCLKCNKASKSSVESLCPLGLPVELDLDGEIIKNTDSAHPTNLNIVGEIVEIPNDGLDVAKQKLELDSSNNNVLENPPIAKPCQENLLENVPFPKSCHNRVIEECLSFDSDKTSNPNYDEIEGVELRDMQSNKRTGSLIDRQTAKEYLEKLTDNIESISTGSDGLIVDTLEESGNDSRFPFVWDVVSKMRNSLNQIPLHLPMRKRTGTQEQAEVSSYESFEVVETNLIDTDTADDSSGSYCISLKRSGSLKSLLELKQDQRVKGRNRKTSIEALVTVNRSRAKKGKKNRKHQEGDRCIQTEVWSWGVGINGQLGHGDVTNRAVPTCIGELSGQCVIKVLSGKGNSVALTADSRLFTWGLNSKGQLGHSFASEMALSPRIIELPSHELIWDVAVGDSHMLLLVDHKAPHVSIYYCGSHERKQGEVCLCPKEKGLHQLNILKKSGLISRVYGGGPTSGCVVNLQGLSELPVFHEFASTERQFLYQLQMILMKLLRPLLSDGIMALLPDLFSEPLQKIIAKLATIADMVALNSYDLTMIVLNGGQLDSTYIADIPEEWLEVFLSYSQLLCDVVSVSAAIELTKEWSWNPNRLKMMARDVTGDVIIEKKTSSEILIYLLSAPIRRARDYAKLFNRISSSNLMRVQEVNVQDLQIKWQLLTDFLCNNLLCAEETKKFWDSAPNKIVDNYRKSSRRLIRDSKTHPIQLQSSGRFSNHWFILFNDILLHHHFGNTQSYPLQTIWVEPLPDCENSTNSFVIRMPEDVLTLVCSTSAQKTKWISALNGTIRSLLDSEKDPHHRIRSLSSGESSQAGRLLPPLPRHATYTFSRTQPFKEATYMGMWLCGKVHGQGEMVWSDSRKYVGKFKQNIIQGEGVMSIPSGEREFYLEGIWKDSKLNGQGCVRYPNGDIYEGTLKDHQRHGHGMLKQGQFLMSAASVYVGQWHQDQRHGYGVLDDIRNGEKYMGMWQDDSRHGKGLVVTIDGIYYEGTFMNDKLQGFGAMMFEDGTFYEGDLGQSGTLNGKGTLFLSNGDHIDGNFNGVWSEGIKINGVYHKSTSISSANDVRTAEGSRKKWSYGELCVSAKSKWIELFSLCKDSLGIMDTNPAQDNTRAWEAVAVALAKHKKEIRHRKRFSQYQVENCDSMEKIPHTGTAKGTLTLSEYREIQLYLDRAFDCPFHPLGHLLENIVDVYRAAYLGVGAHPRLLRHAVAEVRMFLSRVYNIVRVFFPDLPAEHSVCTVRLNSEDCEEDSSDFDFDDPDMDVVSANELLHPLLLPRIYPPLFTLYALYNEKDDEQYWKRLLKWNRQPDMALMAFLGVSQKFWSEKVHKEILGDKGAGLSSSGEIMFTPAVEMLQHISTEFSPREKLKTIHLCFKKINDEVQDILNSRPGVSEEFMWSMDELFPVFQFVVVRARIRHLGSEIHLIDDLMEKHFEMGELGIMFTTLKACYFQIRTEKVQQ